MTTLVPMTTQHIEQLMPHERGMFGAEAWTVSGYRTELADTRHRRYVVAEDADGALLGWAGIRVIADSAEILTVGTVPDARRRGIGAQLLLELLDEARRRGAREVFLEVRPDNEAAIKLYEREGFVEVGRRRGYYDHGRTEAVVMQREV